MTRTRRLEKEEHTSRTPPIYCASSSACLKLLVSFARWKGRHGRVVTKNIHLHKSHKERTSSAHRGTVLALPVDASILASRIIHSKSSPHPLFLFSHSALFCCVSSRSPSRTAMVERVVVVVVVVGYVVTHHYYRQFSGCRVSWSLASRVSSANCTEQPTRSRRRSGRESPPGSWSSRASAPGSDWSNRNGVAGISFAAVAGQEAWRDRPAPMTTTTMRRRRGPR